MSATDLSRRDTLLRLLHAASVRRTAERAAELDQLAGEAWIRLKGRSTAKSPSYALVPEHRGDLERRLEALWPNWPSQVEMVRAAGGDVLDMANYATGPRVAELRLSAPPDAASLAMLEAVCAELERASPGLSLKLGEVRGSSVLVQVSDGRKTLVETFKAEVQLLRHKLENAAVMFREQRAQIGDLKAQIREFAVRFVDVGDAYHDLHAGVLFLDAAGFSGLGNREKAEFVRRFWALCDLVFPSGYTVARTTWGDALMAVVEDVNALLRGALTLVRHLDVEQIDCRVGLSYGPLRTQGNPVCGGAADVSGAAVDEAARLEPFVKQVNRHRVVASAAVRNSLLIDEAEFGFIDLDVVVQKGFGQARAGDLMHCYAVTSRRN